MGGPVSSSGGRQLACSRVVEMKHHTWHGSQNLPRRETDGGSDRLPQGDPESQLSKREPRLHYGPYSIQKQLQVLGAQGPQHYEHKYCPTWEQQKLFQL